VAAKKAGGTSAGAPDTGAQRAVEVNLIAVLVAVTGGEPRLMTLDGGKALPSGPFELEHRSLQSGLRDWVEQQTHHPLGYVEQLYTFADRDRAEGVALGRVISISYLGLTREDAARPSGDSWRSWYDYFPWEDWRAGRPPVVDAVILPALNDFANLAATEAVAAQRRQRIALAFGLAGNEWNEELTLQRYELLFEAGLVAEAVRGGGQGGAVLPGREMIADHRRILATGIARLRAKIKYRPVVFELMPPAFTLLQLQRCVEALGGRLVHKQNFRRLVEQQELVEETGETAAELPGRPAKLFRFRPAVELERSIAGTKLPLIRT